LTVAELITLGLKDGLEQEQEKTLLVSNEMAEEIQKLLEQQTEHTYQCVTELYCTGVVRLTVRKLNKNLV